jgi:hypothetical protein
VIKQNKISHDYFTSNTLQFRQKRKSHQRHFHSDKQLSFSKPDDYKFSITFPHPTKGKKKAATKAAKDRCYSPG